MQERQSGILLPIFSLPGVYGIGTLGESARRFIDFLAEAGQRVWQILPLVPTGMGNSPYMSPSAYAGNPILLDLETLTSKGLITRQELNDAYSKDVDRIDYSRVWENRNILLRKAWLRDRNHEARLAFFEQQRDWLDDHALFCALRAYFGCALDKWPDDAVRRRTAKALASYRVILAEEIDYQIFLQYHFFEQWQALKRYAKQRNVAIMGDLPIYVSSDSVQVWVNPALFQLDANLSPVRVAGVPPDAFAISGQHWGNPLYDWVNQREALFGWWVDRLKKAALLYDMLRLDHFRGFHSYWSIPAGSKSALEGCWEQGPGLPFVTHLTKQLPELTLISEDLGDLDDSARDFIQRSGLPGMKVLIYAFDPQGESAAMPHCCLKNSVMYTSTHDSPTFVEWLFSQATEAERDFAISYLRLHPDEGFGWGAVCGAWISPSSLAIAPLQDILGLGGDARMNVPGTSGAHNWSWRVRSEALNDEVAARLKKITQTYRRN